MADDLKTFRFNFHATISDFILNAPNISSPLVATWKRSTQSVTTSVVQMVNGKVNFNQTVTLPLNMYFEQSKGIFQDKKTLFTFNMNTPKGDKQAGVVYVQVAQILNKKMENLTDTFILEKCPVKDSKVTISIVAELVGEGAVSDNISVDSSVINMNSGPSTLSIESKRSIPAPPSVPQPQKIQQKNVEIESNQKDKIISNLQKQVKQLTAQKQKLMSELQRSKNRDQNKQSSDLKEQLKKSKTLQEKLEYEINNLRSENVEHQRELQKMRMRMEQIYEILFNNLNSLY